MRASIVAMTLALSMTCSAPSLKRPVIDLTPEPPGSSTAVSVSFTSRLCQRLSRPVTVVTGGVVSVPGGGEPPVVA